MVVTCMLKNLPMLHRLDVKFFNSVNLTRMYNKTCNKFRDHVVSLKLYCDNPNTSTATITTTTSNKTYAISLNFTSLMCDQC